MTGTCGIEDPWVSVRVIQVKLRKDGVSPWRDRYGRKDGGCPSRLICLLRSLLGRMEEGDDSHQVEDETPPRMGWKRRDLLNQWVWARSGMWGCGKESWMRAAATSLVVKDQKDVMEG